MSNFWGAVQIDAASIFQDWLHGICCGLLRRCFRESLLQLLRVDTEVAACAAGRPEVTPLRVRRSDAAGAVFAAGSAVDSENPRHRGLSEAQNEPEVCCDTAAGEKFG